MYEYELYGDVTGEDGKNLLPLVADVKYSECHGVVIGVLSNVRRATRRATRIRLHDANLPECFVIKGEDGVSTKFLRNGYDKLIWSSSSEFDPDGMVLVLVAIPSKKRS